MKKENPDGFSFFIGAELRIRVKRGKVKRRHKKIFAGAVYHNAQTSCATLLRRACGESTVYVAAGEARTA